MISGGRPCRVPVPLLLVFVCLLAAGCSGGGEAPLVRRAVAPPAHLDPVHPCTRGPAADAAQRPGAAAPGAIAPRVAIDPAGGSVTLAAGHDVDLPTLAGLAPGALREDTPGRWTLSASLRVAPGASLRVAGPRVRWLALAGPVQRPVSLVAAGGELDVSGTCISSWDPGAGRTDTDPGDGRAFVAAESGGRLVVQDAELHDLGFQGAGSYGLSWRGIGTTGQITDSLVTGSLYGVYTDQVDGIVVRGNEIAGNLRYGIDPHTSSRHLTIEDNVVHDNGVHGIILADDCTDSVVRGNLSYRNGQHGIDLHDRSDRNVVEHNEVFGNGAQGINVNASSGAALRGNRVYDNGGSGVAITELSAGALVEGNEVRGNHGDGVRVVGDSTGAVAQRNVVGENGGSGIVTDSAVAARTTGNTVFGNRVGVVTPQAAVEVLAANEVYDNPVDVRAR